MTLSPPSTSRAGRVRRSGRSMFRILFLLPVLALPLAGCATKRDLRNLQATIQEMNAQNQTLLRELQQGQQMQRDSIRAVSNFLLDLRGDMAGRFAAVENEIMILQGLQGVSQQQLATLRDAVEESRPAPVYAPAGGGVVSSGASELYQRGTAAFTQGQYGAAEFVFREIVDLHQNDPLVPDAHFYLAQIHVEYEEFEDAIAAFRALVEAYPTSPRAPAALFQMGLIYVELENRAEAIGAFTRVVEEYPESDAVESARAELQRLR